MKILIAKKLSFDQISITTSNEEFHFTSEIQQEIDQLWNKKVVESIQKGHKIRDGLNYSLQGYKEDTFGLSLQFGTVRFRNISMTKFLCDTSKKQIEEISPKGIFVSGIIKTSDNYFLFPKRSGKDVTKVIPQEISVIGGVLQPDDCHVKTFNDVRSHMKVELLEEIGVEETHISSGQFIGLTLSRSLNSGIIFFIELSISYHEAIQCFHHSNDGEMPEVIGIPSDQLRTFLTEQGFDDQGNYITNLGLYRDIMQQTHLL